jgi:hypothetical protein
VRADTKVTDSGWKPGGALTLEGKTPPAMVVGTTVDGPTAGRVVDGAVAVVGGEVVAGIGCTVVCGTVCGGGLVIEMALCEGRETATAIPAAAAAAAVATTA